jgi:ribosomal protein S27AE
VLPPVAIVWPCPLSVELYAAAGRDVEVPRPDCPRCGGATSWWSGYRRFVRAGGVSRAIFVPRVRCGRCAKTDAVLPAFVFCGRLDTVETIGAAIDGVAVGVGGVRPAAIAVDVPHTTARGWLRRFASRAARVSVAFAALTVELGGEVLGAIGDGIGQASAAIGSAFELAASLAGWAALGRWRFASAVSGGGLIATNTNTPYLIVGRRRFMPPVPTEGTRREE